MKSKLKLWVSPRLSFFIIGKHLVLKPHKRSCSHHVVQLLSQCNSSCLLYSLSLLFHNSRIRASWLRHYPYFGENYLIHSKLLVNPPSSPTLFCLVMLLYTYPLANSPSYYTYLGQFKRVDVHTYVGTSDFKFCVLE